MGIDNFDVYFEKIKKVLNNVDEFCLSIEIENRLSIARGETNNEIKEIVEKIKETNKAKTKKKLAKKKQLDICTKIQLNFYQTKKFGVIFHYQLGFYKTLSLSIKMNLLSIILT